MIVTSRSNNVLTGASGAWRVWSLCDGYLEMPASLLRDPQDNPVPQAARAGAPLRLSVNCDTDEDRFLRWRCRSDAETV